MKRRRIEVEQDPEQPVVTKVLAQAILDISSAAKKLAASGLNRKAIVALLRDSSGQPKYVVEQVLDALEQLAEDYATNGRKK